VARRDPDGVVVVWSCLCVLSGLTGCLTPFDVLDRNRQSRSDAGIAPDVGPRAVDGAVDAGGADRGDGATPADARGDAVPALDARLAISFPAGSAVAYQIDVAHTGNQPTSALTPPLTRQWSVDLGGSVSYPLVVNGRVFVTVGNTITYGTALAALDVHTGARVWGPIDIGGTYYWSNAAYDQGRVYVVNFDGLLTAVDAATGATLWLQQLPGQYAFSSPPTAAGGLVFVGGAGVGGTLYAVDGTTGAVLWTAPVENGDDSSPAVAADAVYVSYACVQAYAFAPFDGRSLWQHAGGCEGGGGATTALYQGHLWARDWASSNLVLDATTGGALGSFSAGTIPAFAGSRAFLLVEGALRALDVDTRSVLWTFDGDGSLVSAPLVVGALVYVGSASGHIYAVDPETGAERWSDLLPWGISGPDEFDVSEPLAGMGAGDDSLLIGAGSYLTCYR
jgi:outer membrane protein assembly factor BamB